MPSARGVMLRIGSSQGCASSSAHRHEQAEEVTSCCPAPGDVKLGDEIVELAPLDAIRVEPGLMHASRPATSGMECLAFGQHHVGDGELVPGWWATNGAGSSGRPSAGGVAEALAPAGGTRAGQPSPRLASSFDAP